MKPKTIEVKLEGRLAGALWIEDIFCLASLIATGRLSESATVNDSNDYYKNLEQGCNSCPLLNKCLACLINE